MLGGCVIKHVHYTWIWDIPHAPPSRAPVNIRFKEVGRSSKSGFVVKHWNLRLLRTRRPGRVRRGLIRFAQFSLNYIRGGFNPSVSNPALHCHVTCDSWRHQRQVRSFVFNQVGNQLALWVEQTNVPGYSATNSSATCSLDRFCTVRRISRFMLDHGLEALCLDTSFGLKLYYTCTYLLFALISSAEWVHQ